MLLRAGGQALYSATNKRSSIAWRQTLHLLFLLRISIAAAFFYSKPSIQWRRIEGWLLADSWTG